MPSIIVIVVAVVSMSVFHAFLWFLFSGVLGICVIMSIVIMKAIANSHI